MYLVSITRSMQTFNQWIFYYHLLDIPSQNRCYTWSNFGENQYCSLIDRFFMMDAFLTNLDQHSSEDLIELHRTIILWLFLWISLLGVLPLSIWDFLAEHLAEHWFISCNHGELVVSIPYSRLAKAWFHDET